MHDALWAYRFLSKTLNDLFDPTFCVYRVPVYFQILISKITEQRQNFANSDRYKNEDAEINNSNRPRSLAKVLHSSACRDGRCSRGRLCTGDVCPNGGCVC